MRPSVVLLGFGLLVLSLAVVCISVVQIRLIRDWGRRPPALTEAEAAAERWRRINEEERTAGCLCGRPSTHVGYYGPSASWSCEEHQDVGHWTRSGDDGPWTPHEISEEDAASRARWQTPGPRPYTDIDKIRKGTS